MVEKWEEKTFDGPDGNSYETSSLGSFLINFILKEVSLRHTFIPFKPDGDTKNASTNERKLYGLGMLTSPSATIDVVGAQGAKTNQLLISIGEYDEESPQAGEIWIERSKRGWPCEIGTYLNKRGVYDWYCALHISRQLFETLLGLYTSKRIFSLRISVRVGLLQRSDEKYKPDFSEEFFLIAENGNVAFPSKALGFVDSITAVETQLPLHT